MTPTPADHDRLAQHGGLPVRAEPLPAWPHFPTDTIQAVADVLRSGRVNYWTGTHGQRFEARFARLCRCRYAVAVANGTVALELALRASGIQSGDQVIVPARSFIAPASCCRMVGALPVFADIDPESQNITAETIEPLVNRRTRAVIVVHLAGWPCEMEPILALAQRRGLRVIEDCAQALGATYRDQPVGSMGHLGTFSFCQDKILTTGGEGGMLTTNDPLLARWSWSFKDHGKDRALAEQPGADGLFRYVHVQIGTNWRMTEMQAALGSAQLPHLDPWLAARRRNAALLDDRLGRLAALRVPSPPEHVGHARYKHFSFVHPERLRDGWDRDRIVRSLRAEGIPAGTGFCPEIYREAAFSDCPTRPREPLPVAEQLGRTSLMLPIHPTLREGDVRDIADAVEKVMAAASIGQSGQGRTAA